MRPKAVLLTSLVISCLATQASTQTEPWHPTDVDFSRTLSLKYEGTDPVALWRALEEATGHPVVAFLPELPEDFRIEFADLRLGRAFSRIAAAVGGQWRTRYGIICVGPLPPSAEGLPDHELAMVRWVRSLSEEQFDVFAREGLLLVDDLTATQRSALGDLFGTPASAMQPIDLETGEIIEPESDERLQGAVGLFFCPHVAVYYGEEYEAVQVAKPYELLGPFARHRTPTEPWVPRVPPGTFVRDAEGSFVAYRPAAATPVRSSNLPSSGPDLEGGPGDRAKEAGRSRDIPEVTESPSANAPASALLEASDDEPHAVSALLGMIREVSMADIVADGEELANKVHVSRGAYRCADLLVATCHAGGLWRSRVDGTEYIAPTDEEVRQLAGLPPLPPRFSSGRLFAAHCRAALTRLIEEFDYRGSNMPFRAEDFIDSERVGAGGLPEDQWQFVKLQLWDGQA